MDSFHVQRPVMLTPWPCSTSAGNLSLVLHPVKRACMRCRLWMAWKPIHFSGYFQDDPVNELESEVSANQKVCMKMP